MSINSFFKRKQKSVTPDFPRYRKQALDACEKEIKRLEKIQSKLITEAYLTWLNNLLIAKKAEEVAKIKKLKADGSSPQDIKNSKRDFEDDKRHINRVIKIIKSRKSDETDDKLITSLSHLSSHLRDARIKDLQFTTNHEFANHCSTTFRNGFNAIPDNALLKKKIVTIKVLQGSIEKTDDAEKLANNLENIKNSSKPIETLASRRNKIQFWNVIDRILHSLKKPASTMGVKSHQFAKHLNQLLFKATKKSILKSAKENAASNKNRL